MKWEGLSGKSGADVERILAFHAIGRIDPVEYVEDWEVVLSGALKAQLRHYVMKENGTERPFTGEYDKHFEAGNYHCADCDENSYSPRIQNLILAAVGLHLVKKMSLQTSLN